ncbi:uncharacterized protein LOC116766536 isoform X2 [Danaus plexippus]|uniref:Uncharacterized protein n=1 Tax=Danaus plexippus plexippus TaxID=278856 RepID=A0A212FHE1_DANPL|nr:uncharacterized protein LOC116766536 isoform X2 [Danaus plexippus]OWR53143.1 hypothetical protein KGM_207446 [Danaus plexippus plexippus]
MPASSINLYHMQDAKNNFNTMQLAPVCADADVLMGQCQNYHVSTNCYYGFHGQKSVENMQDNYDCEMTEVDSKTSNATTASRQNNSRKRSAEDSEYPQTKRLREEGMVPSTTTYNPCLLRPTHNNPDITRCLMVHMI